MTPATTSRPAIGAGAIDKRKLQLGTRLRELRTAAGFATGKALAERLGWQASKVSRLENGQQLVTDADLAAWFEAVSAPPDTAAELRDDLLDIRLEQAAWRRQLRAGHAPRQRYSEDIESKAAVITYVELNVVPGPLQTADYARAVLAASAELHQVERDVGEAVAVRMRRQQVLYDTTKRFEFLVTESALRYSVCPPSGMVAQIDRLVSLLGVEHVRLGVIPLGVRLAAVPMHGYVIVDDLVLVEMTHSELSVDDPHDLDLYRRLTSALWTSAVEGDAARRLLLRVGEAWRLS
ncbi:helix-turn-helix domain-containing protein [Actinosynnema sp. CA-248983]